MKRIGLERSKGVVTVKLSAYWHLNNPINHMVTPEGVSCFLHKLFYFLLSTHGYLVCHILHTCGYLPLCISSLSLEGKCVRPGTLCFIFPLLYPK